MACARSAGIPSDVFVWVVLESGRVFYDRPLFVKNLSSTSVLYVYEPDHPTCRKERAKASAEAARKKKEAKAREEREAKERAAKAAKERAAKEAKAREDALKAEKARAQEKAREAQKGRERKRQAQAGAAAPKPQQRARKPGLLPNQKDASQLPNQKDASQLPNQPDASPLPTVTKGPVPQPMTALCQGCAPEHMQCPVTPAPASHVVSLADAKNDPAKMPVRASILAEVVAYEKARGKGEAQREAHRRKLRELFESIPSSAALRFHVMLAGKNDLAKKFRAVLNCDPLHNELLAILKAKYSPAPAVARVAPKDAVALALSEAAFAELHAQLKQGADVMHEAGTQIVGSNMQTAKAKVLKDVSFFKQLLGVGQKLREKAFSETDPAARAKAIKVAGDVYTALVALSPFWGLYINIASTTGEADISGVSAYPNGSWITGRSALDKLLRGFEEDSAIETFYQAALAADVKAMNNAFAAASLAYQRHLQGLDPWVRAINRGAFRSKQIIAVADTVMIAISVYQGWKALGISPGGSQKLPPITGLLPGGVALSSRLSPVALEKAVESIRRLVAIGALDGAIIAGVSRLGGGPGVVPELQRPTSLSVAKPSQPSGDTASPKPTEGRGPPPAADNYRGRYNAARAAQGKARLPKDWDAHHRIPQAYRNHPEFKGFDFDAPSNIQGVQGRPPNANIHAQITKLWQDFDKIHPNPNRKQIEAFARFIDSKFQAHWWK